MIERKTVFVLGAGASMPYGFPSGAQLRDTICEGANDGAWLTGVLYDYMAIAPPDTQDFARAFLASNVASIDSFLSRRGEYTDIGKLAIAACLCVKEKPEWIYAKPNDDDWYHLLWNKLIESTKNRQEFAQNEVRFISFNYDRSLEYFLHTSTKNTYGGSDDKAMAAWSHLEILHVYGMLGKFGYAPGQLVRQYSEELTDGLIFTAANGIHVIPEARQDDEVFKKARRWFDWAEQICFLGFGFDPLNVERLGLDSVLVYKREKSIQMPTIVASIFGKTNAEKFAIQNKLCPTSGWQSLTEKNAMTLRHSSVLN